MSQQPRKGSPLKTLATSLLASPVAAVWLATGRSQWLWRGSALLVTLGLAAALLLPRLRWQVVTASWAAYCLVGGLLAAFLLGFQGKESVERPEGEGASGWGSATLLAALPIAFFMPGLLAFARLLGWTVVGRALVRLNPDAVDPEQLLGLLVVEAFWVAPCGLVFAAYAFRRGRLGSVKDLLLASMAWLWVLWLQEIFVLGSFGALRSQMIWTQGYESWGTGQTLLLKVALVLAVVPMTSFLAWGQGRWWRRGAAVTGLVTLAFLNLSLLLGILPQAQFVAGRVLERSGQTRQALGWYDRSLVANPNPLLASYLQHRIGLLNYKLGKLDEARNAFREVLTARNANRALVDESNYYLDRLSLLDDGERVVLEGIDVDMEARRAYCAPNTLSLVFGHWGKNVSVRELGEDGAGIGRGTSSSTSRFLAEKQGLEFHFVPFADLDDLRWLVDRGLPAVVFTPRHVLSVFGYDDRLGTVVAFDTAKWDVWVDRPYHEFLRDWGAKGFYLAVVLPKGDESPVVREARARFVGRRSEAAWLYWLSREELDWDHRLVLLKRAILVDPTFPLPALNLMLLNRGWGEWSRSQEDNFAWLLEHADGDAIIAEARLLLEREYAPVHDLAPGLALWFFETGRLEEAVALGMELDRRGRLSLVGGFTGRAAAGLGRWEQAAFMLQANEDDLDREELFSLFAAESNLGQRDAAAATLSELVGVVSGDRLEDLVKQAEALAPGRGPAFLEGIYSSYLYSRPEDLARQLRLAELSVEAVENLAGDQRRQRLQQARQAATRVVALSEDPELREGALAVLEGLKRRLTPGSIEAPGA